MWLEAEAQTRIDLSIFYNKLRVSRFVFFYSDSRLLTSNFMLFAFQKPEPLHALVLFADFAESEVRLKSVYLNVSRNQHS
jgi:hypothetical protein